MKIVSETENKIILRGFEYLFSNYGVELNFINNKLDNVTLNMYDRNISINYFNEWNIMGEILKQITSVLFEKEVTLKANQQFQTKNKIYKWYPKYGF